MGLLDTFIQSIQDLNPEWTKDRLKTAGGLLADVTPVVGDVKAGYDMVDSARQGNYGEAALNGLGLLPFVPAMGGIVKGAGKSGFDLLDELYANAPKQIDSQSSIQSLIKDIQSKSDSLSDKVYKRNSQRVEIGSSVDNVPTGEFGRGDMSIGLINENRRQRKLDDYGSQIKALEKLQHQGSDVINAQLKDALGRVPELRQWLGKTDGMTDMDVASMFVNSEILKLGNYYGPTTPGYKLLKGIQ